MQTLPLFKNSRYSYRTTLDGNLYKFSYHWNREDESWYMDIDGVSNDEAVSGIRLATGPNLLKPYAILPLGAIYMLDGKLEGTDPNYDDIGGRYSLIYVSTTEPDAII